jgi:hypothetical protein
MNSDGGRFALFNLGKGCHGVDERGRLCL